MMYCLLWRHDVETLSVLVALCEWNPLFIGGLQSQRASNIDILCFIYWQPEQAIGYTAELPVMYDAMPHVTSLKESEDYILL